MPMLGEYLLKGLEAPRGYYYYDRSHIKMNYQNGELARPSSAPIPVNNSPISPLNKVNRRDYESIDMLDESPAGSFEHVSAPNNYIMPFNIDGSNAPFFIPYHFPSAIAHLRQHMVSPFAGQTAVLSYTLLFARMISQALELDHQDAKEHLSLFILIFFLAIAVDLAYHLICRLAVHTKEAIFSSQQSDMPVVSNLLKELRHHLQKKAPAAVNRGLVIAFIIAGYFISSKTIGYYAAFYEALYATMATLVMNIQKKADAAFLHLTRSVLCDAFYKGLPVAIIGLIYTLMKPLNYIETSIPAINNLIEGLILSSISMFAYSGTTAAVALIDYVLQKIYLSLTYGVNENTPAVLKAVTAFTDSIMLDAAIVVDATDTDNTLTQSALPSFILLQEVKKNTEPSANLNKIYAPVVTNSLPFANFC